MSPAGPAGAVETADAAAAAGAAASTRAARARAGAGADPVVGAVVLAAGRSSRMGTPKPLLRVGRLTAVERIVRSLRDGGVQHAVVVTGHEAEALTPLLDTLGVVTALNPHYDSGMFSSVQAGVAALPPGLEAFFVLPVDHPLVRPAVLRTLRRRWSERGLAATETGPDGPILHPACCGLRGHPPLLAASCRALILEAGPGTTLRDLLNAHDFAAQDVEVEDLSILMDMDTPADHRVLHRFAEILDSEATAAAGAVAGAATGTVAGATDATQATDAAEADAAIGPRALTDEESLFILAALATPENVVRHCRAVAAVGHTLAAALEPRLPHIHPAAVRSACLLHDMVRTVPGHATIAQRLLANLGLPELGLLVGQHMVMDPDRSEAPGITEIELVYLADKVVAEDEVVGLDGRESRALEKMRSWPEATPAAFAQMGDRMRSARRIAAKVEAVLGYPLSRLLSQAQIPGVAGLRAAEQGAVEL